MSRLTAIGLMSGTSYDGVDVAIVDTDGEEIEALGPTGYRPYSEQERDLLRRAMAAASTLTSRTDERQKILVEVEELVTDIHAEAVEAFLAANGMLPNEVAVVGFHGQTVVHRPERRLTVQLGNGPALSARLGIPVVYDFRAADVEAGGQGAPIVPAFHRAMVRKLKRPHPIGVLNLGGVANLTFVDAGTLIAFDTGPGNAAIDDFLRLRTGQPRDDEGRTASAGAVDEAAVSRVLAHPFFARPPPKSLDRNTLRQWIAEEGRLSDKSTEDGAATLTAITAAAVACATNVLPALPACWIAAGGGTRNPTLIRLLRERLAPASVETADAVGWSAEALEAQALAYLAVRSLKDLPLTFPSTTGVPVPMRGGVLARPP